MMAVRTSGNETHQIDERDVAGVELADETEAKYNIYAHLHLHDGTHLFLPSRSYHDLPERIKHMKFTRP